MPTPFYHLALAQALLADERVPQRTRALLQEQRGAFLYGNTAPDVQTVSGQARDATHFFRVPLVSDTPAGEVMLRRYPTLAAPAIQSPAKLAFVAGYLCHLDLDQSWIREIFAPLFGLQAAWETFQERIFLHNVMRVYLDRQDLPLLGNGVAQELLQAAPQAWLPFVPDAHLCTWRDFLAAQLRPGANIQTVAVFAERMGRSPAEFERLLDSPAALQNRLWTHAPLAQLQAFRNRALARSVKLVQSYLEAC